MEDSFFLKGSGTIGNALPREGRFRMCSAALCTYSAERLFYISQFWKICGFSRIAFSREGSRRETAFAALVSCGNSRAARERARMLATGSTPSVCSLRSQPPSPRGRLNPLSHRYAMPAPPKGEPLAWRESFLLHLNFNSGANGVRPLRLCFANPPLPKGEARALPEAFSLFLTL